MLKFNIFTGTFDIAGMTIGQMGEYLKLDQTTPQNVINGSPQFDEGLTIKADKRVYLDGS
jgi:hypothetical protein